MAKMNSVSKTIEMEMFEVSKFLDLASHAKYIRVNAEQCAYIRSALQTYTRLIPDTSMPNTWRIFDAQIVIEDPVDESAARNIIFEMEEYKDIEQLPFIFHKQTILHNPPEQIGNCMQTVVAGLLGKQIHEVPHFGAGMTFDRSNPELRAKEGGEFMDRVHAYLKSINYRFFEVYYDADLDGLKNILKMNGGIPLLVSGESKRGTNHSVITYNGEFYDPHPDGTGLTGPMDNGYWSVGVLVKVPGYFAKEI